VIAEDYVRVVSFELRDLPWKIRRDLVSELRSHLAELRGDTDLVRRLGAPKDYAADLRAAAGLERRRGVIAFLKARRLRNLIITAVALAITGLAIGAVVWIDSYQPIVFAGSTQSPDGVREARGIQGDAVVFRRGRPFRFGFTVRNNGRFTVRVLGVPYSPVLPVSARLLMSGPQKEPGMEQPWKRFHPFDLKPGEIRWLVLEGAYACRSGMGPGTSSGIDVLPVRFSFLWRVSTTWIPFGSQLTFLFPRGCRYAVAGR
jgi:HAAS domain-containing protein